MTETATSAATPQPTEAETFDPRRYARSGPNDPICPRCGATSEVSAPSCESGGKEDPILRHCKVCNLLFCTVDAWEKFRAQREEDLRGAPETRPDGAPVHANYGGKTSPPAEGGGQPDGQPINGAGFPPPESSIEVYFHGVRIPPHMAAWPPHVVAGAVVPALQSDIAMAREHAERYSMRLAGVLGVAEGVTDRAEIEDEGTVDFVRSCPTIAAVLKLREDFDELEQLWEQESRRIAVGGPAELIRSIVATAIGAASMCWNPRPSTEVFDSTAAGRVVDDLIQSLQLPGYQPDATFEVVEEAKDLQGLQGGPIIFGIDPRESGGSGDAAMQAAVRIVAALEKSRLVEVDHHRTRNSLQDGIAAEIRQTMATVFAATIADREAMARDLEAVQTRNDELERAMAARAAETPAEKTAFEPRKVVEQVEAIAVDVANALFQIFNRTDVARGPVENLIRHAIFRGRSIADPDTIRNAPLTHSRALEQVVDFAVDRILDAVRRTDFETYRREIAAHVRGACEAARGVLPPAHGGSILQAVVGDVLAAGPEKTYGAGEVVTAFPLGATVSLGTPVKPYSLYPKDVEPLRQLLVITWDGNLVSKDARDRFVAAGLAARTSEGGNIITPAGVNALGSAGELPRLESIGPWLKQTDIAELRSAKTQRDNLQGHLRERDRKFHELEEKMREVRRGEKILAEALRP